MEEYYNLFIELSLKQCTKQDYADKQKVKRHNAAIRELALLESEMKRNDCTEILGKLLRHEDDRVKINAASLCLQTGMLIEEAKKTLNYIISFSTDSTISFCAEMVLKIIHNTNSR